MAIFCLLDDKAVNHTYLRHNLGGLGAVLMPLISKFFHQQVGYNGTDWRTQDYPIYLFIILTWKKKFPSCLCSISTRQLEPFFWRAGLTAQYLQDCPIVFIQLNYIHKSKQNKVLPPYVKLPCHKVANAI